MISSVEGVSLCLNGGCGIGLYAVLVSALCSDVFSEPSLLHGSVVVSMF